MLRTELRLELLKLCYNPGHPLTEVIAKAKAFEAYVSEDEPKPVSSPEVSTEPTEKKKVAGNPKKLS